MTGWKLVPVEPVNDMENAGVDEGANHFGLGVDEGQVSAIWRAMRDAAPSTPDEVLERMAMAHWETRRTGFSVPRLGLHEVVNWPDLPADFRAKEIEAMRAALTAAESEQHMEGGNDR